MSEFFISSDDGKTREMFDGIVMHAVPCEKSMLSRVSCQPGSVIPPHSHPHEQVGIVLAGSAVFRIGSEERELATGAMYRIPGTVEHSVIAGADGLEALDVFCPVREDYL